MDTRVATAELGWTAYPNSGVSLSLPQLGQTEKNGDMKDKTKSIRISTPQINRQEVREDIALSSVHCSSYYRYYSPYVPAHNDLMT